MKVELFLEEGKGGSSCSTLPHRQVYILANKTTVLHRQGKEPRVKGACTITTTTYTQTPTAAAQINADRQTDRLYTMVFG
jgi:hypothetical protein